MIFIGDAEITRLILAVVLLLGSAYLFGYIFEYCKMPKVIGEILGGLVLGPTVLGAVAPAVYDNVFDAFEFEGQALSVFYWMGLILLMFVSGLEQEKWGNELDRKLIILLIIVSTTIPICCGYLTTYYINLGDIVGVQNNIMSLKIIFAISMAITSIPVISKIFIDLGLIQTVFAKTILAIAVVHDVILWAGVAVATALISKDGQTDESLWTGIAWEIFVVVAMFLISLTILPKIMSKANTSKINIIAKYSPVGCAIIFCLMFIIIADLLNVSVMFGALLAGLVLGISFSENMEKIKNNIKIFSMAFFIPIYFALVGIRIDLIADFNFKYIVITFILSFVFQFVATAPTVWFLKKDFKLAMATVISLNAKGGPGIVLATVAFDLGIINSMFFTTLIITTVLTSLLAGWWLKHYEKDVSEMLAS